MGIGISQRNSQKAYDKELEEMDYDERCQKHVEIKIAVELPAYGTAQL